MTLGSSHGPAYTLSSVFQFGGTNFFDNARQRPGFGVHEMRSILLHGYNGVQYAISRFIPYAAAANPAPEVQTLDYLKHLLTQIPTVADLSQVT